MKSDPLQALALTVAPDDTPEKNYFMQKWNNWIAFEDGVLNYTASRFFQPAVTNPFETSTPFVTDELPTKLSAWALVAARKRKS